MQKHINKHAIKTSKSHLAYYITISMLISGAHTYADPIATESNSKNTTQGLVVAKSLANTRSTVIDGPLIKDEQHVNDNFLEIYIDPSIVRLGWESPKELAKSYLKATLKQSFSDQFPLREGFQEYSNTHDFT